MASSAEPQQNALHGSCACERNQYTILLPSADSASSQASVFFDNSAANRRSQATPLTAWLRVPLVWYHSQTFALFPDETHTSIRRTFHTPTQFSRRSAAGREVEGREEAGLPPTRRQFCGYCGTHLSAWNEAEVPGGGRGGREWMDVTLGSLLDESLRDLESLGVLASSDNPSSASDDEQEEEEDETTADTPMPDTDAVLRRTNQLPNPMRHRGLPYFESMVENSRLGRIKRQKGGHTSRDGRTTVRWEVMEIDGNDVLGEGQPSSGEVVEERVRSKRPRLEE